MKKFIRFISGSMALLLAAACSTDGTTEYYDPSGSNPESAFFLQSSLSREFALDVTGDQIINVTISRSNADGDATIGLNHTIDEDSAEFIAVPLTASFKDGEYETTVPVTVSNITEFVKGKTYTAAISIGDHHEFTESEAVVAKGQLKRYPKTRAAATGYTSIKLSFALELDWQNWYILKDPTKLLEISEYSEATKGEFKTNDKGEPLVQTAIWHDWGWEENVEAVVQRAVGTNVFRLYQYQIDEDEKAVNIIWTVNDAEVEYEGEKYHTLTLTSQSTGVAYDDTDDYCVVDVPTWRGDERYHQYYPSIWDGEYGFYFTLRWHISSDMAMGWNSYSDGFSDVFEFSTGEAPEPAPAVSIVYTGAETSATGIVSHKLSFTPNADAAKYYATIVAVDPELEAAATYYTNAFLARNDIEEYSDDWYYYFDTYYEIYFEMLAEYFVEDLEEMRESVESGEYTDYPVVTATKAISEAWPIEEAGSYTAVAFSYDKTGKYTGVDFKVFKYNPDGDSDAVEYDLYLGAYSYPAYGFFGSNSFYFFLQSYNGDITGVQYALVKADEFDAESASEAELIKYVAANGTAMNGSDLAYVNDISPATGGYEDFLAAKPATGYYLITVISTADATKVEVTYGETYKPEKHNALAVRAVVTDQLWENGYFSHSHAIGVFTGSHMTGGAYLSAAQAVDEDGELVFNDNNPSFGKELDALVTVDATGKVTLKSGVTENDVIEFIADNGSKFTSGTNTSDLYKGNTGSQIQKPTASQPESFILVLGTATYTDDTSSCAMAAVKTLPAPVANFTQTASLNGGKVSFTWMAEPDYEDFDKVTAVTYSLISAADLQAAGVNTSKIADSDLNYNRDADNTVDEANIEAIEALLAAQGKTFTGDVAAKINTGGYSATFNEAVSGDYYLVAKAYTADKYVTKITVSAL